MTKSLRSVDDGFHEGDGLVQGSEKSGRHHRGGDQVFLTFLSSGIGIPDIVIFRNPEVSQDQAS
jgi:hypothetical protein